MKIPKPKFKIGDRVEVDKFDKATIAEVGAFRRKSNPKEIYISYKLKDNILAGFWANESRLKKVKIN
jgi:hypothetical protein